MPDFIRFTKKQSELLDEKLAPIKNHHSSVHPALPVDVSTGNAGFPLMFRITDGTRVTTRSNCVFTHDSSASAHGCAFASALILQHLFCSGIRFGLGAMDAGRSGGIQPLVSPESVGALVYGSILAFHLVVQPSQRGVLVIKRRRWLAQLKSGRVFIRDLKNLPLERQRVRNSGVKPRKKPEEFVNPLDFFFRLRKVGLSSCARNLSNMEEYEKLRDNFVHLARVALSQRAQDVHALLHRIAKQNPGDKELSSGLIELLRKQPTRSSPLRRASEVAIPVDTDSRFQLLRTDEHPFLANEPIYEESVQRILTRLVGERKNAGRLLEAGIEPTKTALFTGPPGVGKTLAAKWIARELDRPLLILDLSAVMSSYLGRTGSNLRHVLDYAKSMECVLLLDELDAIAKRRDDSGEIGELKRLVTVLLQQLDDWPATGLLLAATNHSELLDPAVWRRFEEVIEFPLPERTAAKSFITELLKGAVSDGSVWPEALSVAMARKSFNDIERAITNIRRVAAVSGGRIEDYLHLLVRAERHSKQELIELAATLVDSGLVSQRKAKELTGVARETIRSRVGNSTKQAGKKA